MTKLAANCGCGWRSVPADQSKQGNTVTQAQHHADTFGHKVEVHGWVQPRKINTSTLPYTQQPDTFKGYGAPSRTITGR